MHGLSKNNPPKALRSEANQGRHYAQCKHPSRIANAATGTALQRGVRVGRSMRQPQNTRRHLKRLVTSPSQPPSQLHPPACPPSWPPMQRQSQAWRVCSPLRLSRHPQPSSFCYCYHLPVSGKSAGKAEIEAVGEQRQTPAHHHQDARAVACIYGAPLIVDAVLRRRPSARPSGRAAR